MRKLILLLSLLAASCGSNSASRTPGPVPDFTAVDLNPSSPTDGQSRSLSSQGGKGVVIYFVSYT